MSDHRLQPVVSIHSESTHRSLSGVATITGTASDPDGAVRRVEMSLSGGGWFAVGGNAVWSRQLDTTTMHNGEHHLEARAFDGTNYSESPGLGFSVRNAASPRLSQSGPPPLPICAAAAAAAAAALLALLILRGMRGRARAAEAPASDQKVRGPPPTQSPPDSPEGPPGAA